MSHLEKWVIDYIFAVYETLKLTLSRFTIFSRSESVYFDKKDERAAILF
jgi:hypothetical protein